MFIELFHSSKVCSSIPPNFMIPAEFTKPSNLLYLLFISSYNFLQSFSELISPYKKVTRLTLSRNFSFARAIFFSPLETEIIS